MTWYKRLKRHWTIPTPPHTGEPTIVSATPRNTPSPPKIKLMLHLYNFQLYINWRNIFQFWKTTELRLIYHQQCFRITLYFLQAATRIKSSKDLQGNHSISRVIHRLTGSNYQVDFGLRKMKLNECKQITTAGGWYNGYLGRGDLDE